MTNFLTQLAARTLELTPIVQPRIASVFASEVGQGSETIAPPQSTAAEIAGSAAPAAIASQPLLVNSSRSTLLIAHLPRPIAPPLVPPTAPGPEGLPESTASLEQARPVPDVPSVISDSDSGAAAGNLKGQSERDRELVERDRTEPAVTSKGKFPLPSSIPSSVELLPNTPPPAAVPVEIKRVSLPVLPGAVPIESAIGLNELQAAQSPDPPSPATIATQPSSGDRQVNEGRISLSDQWVSGEAVKRQTAVSTAPPAIVQPADQMDVGQLAPAVPPLAVPRQADAVPPAVSQARSHRQTREVPAVALPPTIHVTIGRIEVRAVPSSAPPRPRAATAPARLSLEAYLRSRSGGNP